MFRLYCNRRSALVSNPIIKHLADNSLGIILRVILRNSDANHRPVPRDPMLERLSRRVAVTELS
jgi:hypothetical protein